MPKRKTTGEQRSELLWPAPFFRIRTPEAELVPRRGALLSGRYQRERLLGTAECLELTQTLRIWSQTCAAYRKVFLMQ
ncbi:hypothetical protein M378DRAFT_236678 [Amanita muscaria Koide BX008]|uniref:Uncharacterized protein n=1 Tax=Amanita muscaria (strain Koide BX008) TaxID=946122 RepID=A0A0C2T6Q7_AMAMK|nr:hypothetical protein M378DRAFT_236678 [Amanita muscaria Koide BX008]